MDGLRYGEFLGSTPNTEYNSVTEQYSVFGVCVKLDAAGLILQDVGSSTTGVFPLWLPSMYLNGSFLADALP